MGVDVQDLVQTTFLGEAAENAPLGIFVADEEMRYVAANRRACELVGYARETLLELRVSDVSPYPFTERSYAELIAAGEFTGHGRLVRSDGQEVDVEVWAAATRVAQMTVYVAFVRATA